MPERLEEAEVADWRAGRDTGLSARRAGGRRGARGPPTHRASISFVPTTSPVRSCRTHNIINCRLGISRAAFRPIPRQVSPEDALDRADGDPVDPGGLGDRQPVLHPGSDARVFGPRDLTRGRGLGVNWCRDFLVADRCRSQDRQSARLPGGSLGRGHGVRDRWLDGLPLWREERLGRPARARDPLAVVTAEVVLLLPVGEQGWSSRPFDHSRDRSGIRQFWQVVTAFAGCHVNIKIDKSS
jgi:hypothetical protein